MTLKQMIGIPLIIIFLFSMLYQLVEGMQGLHDVWLSAFFICTVGLILAIAIRKVLQS